MVEDKDFIGKIWKQNCGDSILVIEKTSKKQNNNYLWKCQFQKYPYEIYCRKDSVLNGSVLNPRIEIEEFLNKEWKQNCGDSLRIINKIEVENSKDKMFEVEFLKYPCKVTTRKNLIINGQVVNPQIEKVEFIDKIWKQNCGDSLRIIKKGEKPGYWFAEFIKYPYIICRSKRAIQCGNVINPRIEEEEFIGSIIPQNCGDSIKILEKTNKIVRGEAVYHGKFINFPYDIYFSKSEILKKYVKNHNLPYLHKDSLINFIDENFNDTLPTLEELSTKLGISCSHINHIINNFGLKYKIKYFESKPEKELKILIFDLLKENYNNFYLKNGQEIDIYIPNLKLGIEYNGNLWHSNHEKFGVSNNYHQEKSLNAKKENIQLFHIFEYEWEDEIKKNIIKDILKFKLNKNENLIIYARKCRIKELDYKTYANFCNENHLQGECGAKIRLGLFYEEKLIQIMSFSCPRFIDFFDWEIIRECSKLGYIVVGGKEKLWSYFVKKYNPKNCISYCDFSKFTGESYLKLGFKKERLNKPGFVWWDKNKRCIYWRNPYKNQEMKDKGYLKIYDCGQLVFSWTK